MTMLIAILKALSSIWEYIGLVLKSFKAIKIGKDMFLKLKENYNKAKQELETKKQKEKTIDSILKIIGTRDTENTILEQFNMGTNRHDILDSVYNVIDDNKLHKHYYNQVDVFMSLFFNIRDKINNKTCSDKSIIDEFKNTFYYYQKFLEEVYSNLDQKLNEKNLYDLSSKTAMDKYKEFMETYNDYIFKKIKDLFQNDVLLVNLKKLKEITYNDTMSHFD